MNDINLDKRESKTENFMNNDDSIITNNIVKDKKEEIVFSKLPILDLKDTILKKIEINNIILVCGETGSGKTTQIPLYLYDQYQRKNKLDELKILCVQPRRLACINISERLTYLCKNKSHVGYHISLDSQQKIENKILFVTNGIFKNYLVHKPYILEKYTHIILDEIHERDIDCDFNLIMLKCLLNYYKIKLIMMSATINQNIFSNYFSLSSIKNIFKSFDEDENKKEIDFLNNEQEQDKKIITKKEEFKSGKRESKSWKSINKKIDLDIINENIKKEKNVYSLNNTTYKDSAPIIEIKTKRNYNITEYFIDNFQTFKNFKSKYLKYFEKVNHFDKNKALLIDENIKLSFDLIFHFFKIYSNYKLLNTNILIFLPGLNEILYMEERIEEKLKNDLDRNIYNIDLENIEIVKLHSSLDGNFDRLKYINNCKDKLFIILATNIAESSLTIKNVSHIIDFCLTKELHFNNIIKNESLKLIWSSKASCRQRMGRTGRTCDGICFNMVTKFAYDNYFSDFSNAEILRTPLDKIILKINNLFEIMVNKYKKEIIGNDKNDTLLKMIKIFKYPLYVLKNALEPPEKVNIVMSINNLKNIGALEIANKNNFNLNINNSVLNKIFSNNEIYLKSTFLGKLYSELPCNINLTKLILFGYYFGILDYVITIVAIYSNIKKFFKFPDLKNIKIKNEDEKTKILLDFINYFGIYNNENDDSIFLLNLYNELIKEFSTRFRLDINFKNKLKNNYYNYYKYVDFKTLRYIIELKKNINKKLKNLGIYSNDYNSNSKSKDIKLKKLKICILSAFYPRQIRCEVNTNIECIKYKELCISEGFNPLFTIIFKNKYFENIFSSKNTLFQDNLDLIKLFNKKYKDCNKEEYFQIYKDLMDKKLNNLYKNIKKSRIISDYYFVEFEENSNGEMRKLLYVYDQKYKYFSKSFIHSLEEDGYKTFDRNDFLSKKIKNLEKNFNSKNEENKTELSNDIKIFINDDFFDIININRLYILDLNTYKEIYVSNESMFFNHFLTNSKETLYLTPAIINDQSSRNVYANNITIQFSNKYIPELLNLIFNNKLILIPSKNKYDYDKYQLDSEIMLFEYYYDEEDIKLINIIKKEIYCNVYNFNTNEDNQYDSEKIFEYFTKLFNKDKRKLLYHESWYDKFKSLDLNKTSLEYDNNPSKLSINKRLEIILSKNNIPNITSKKTMEDINNYIEWKKKIINLHNLIKEIISLSIPRILCNNCKNKIMNFNFIFENLNSIDFINNEFPYIKRKSLIDIKLTEEYLFDQINNSDIKNIEFIKKYKYVYTCNYCNYIYGYSHKDTHFHMNNESILVKMINNKDYYFNIKQFDYEEIEENTKHNAKNDRNRYINDFSGLDNINYKHLNYGCIICSVKKDNCKFKDQKDFHKHFETNIHKDNFIEFCENLN